MPQQTLAEKEGLFDPYSKEFAQNPYPFYARLREEAPVYFHPEYEFWAISRYHDLLNVFADPATFISGGGVTIEAIESSDPYLVVQDGKNHAVAKSMLVQLFSAPRMAALDTFIREKASALIEAAAEKAGGGEVNFVSELTVRLPLDVISELLGIPEEYRESVHRLSHEIVKRGEGSSPEQNEKARAELMNLYMGLLKERRKNPGDDPISLMIKAEAKDENGVVHRMDDFTVAIRFLELGFAGHDTVAKAIPSGAMAFANFPDERRKLKADPSLLPNMVHEIARFEPPLQIQGRTASRDAQVAGVTIPAGDRVMLLIGAGTRDPSAFPDPDRFMIDREPDRHSLAFGNGVHKCLGVHLARREIAIFYEELFARFPDWQVFPDRAERSVQSNLRGVSVLPINFGRHA